MCGCSPDHIGCRHARARRSCVPRSPPASPAGRRSRATRRSQPRLCLRRGGPPPGQCRRSEGLQTDCREANAYTAHASAPSARQCTQRTGQAVQRTNASYTRCLLCESRTRLLSNFKPKHRVAVHFCPPFISCSSLSEPSPSPPRPLPSPLPPPVAAPVTYAAGAQPLPPVPSLSPSPLLNKIAAHLPQPAAAATALAAGLAPAIATL
jgi:hypothetical protein